MVSDSFPKVAIVILNWNGQKYLQQFLPFVIAHSPGCQVIVADNDSTDNSVAYLQQEFPEVTLIRHEQNLGFCEGYNQALSRLDATYFVLLNSDVEVTAGWLRPIITLMETDETIAACQPKIKSYYHRTKFEYAGAGGGFIDFLGYPFCRGRIFESVEEDNGQYNDTAPVFWATGACLIIKATAYKKAQGLEPTFFAHMEEIDLCWRLQLLGYKIMYYGQSEVFHVGGGTLHKTNPRKTYLNFRNGLALLYKNVAPHIRIKTVFTRVALDWIAALKFLTDGHPKDAKAVLRAHWHVWQHRKYWKSRQHLAQNSNLLNPDLVHSNSIVWEYFIKGRKTYAELNVPNRAALPA